MNWREIIRSVLREEQAPQSMPAPTATLTDSDLLQRLALFAELKTLNEQRSSLDARENEISDDARHLATLEIEAKVIRQRIAHHQTQLWSERLTNSCAIDRVNNLLRGCASLQLDEFVAMMDAEHARLRSLAPSERYSHGERTILSEFPRTPKFIYSNAPAIGRRLTAVTAARFRAEELKTLDRTEDELRAELEGLHQALPAFDNCFELVDKI